MPKKSGRGPGRRGFLKSVAMTAWLPGEAGRAQTGAAAPAPKFAYPRTFTGRQLALIAFPLGGVGVGSIGLGGRGQLRDWEIFNRPDKGKSPRFAFAAVRAQAEGEAAVTRVLEARIMPPYEGPSGLGSANAPGLPRLESAAFTGEFPLAGIAFHDPKLPVQLSLEAFSPFIPLEADESGLPVALLRYRAVNKGTVPVRVSIAFSLDNPVGEQGRSNEVRKGAKLPGLYMSNPFLSKTDALAGSFALALLEPGDAAVTCWRGWPNVTWSASPQLFWDDFSDDGSLGPEPDVRNTVGALCAARTLAPQAQAEFAFLLAWHFPNRTPRRAGWQAPKGEEDAIIGNHYCARFPHAWAAAEYAAAHWTELEEGTRIFAAAMRRSTLPSQVREAATANLSTLVTPTSFRTADGVFHGFEGCDNQSGCCFGSCTHVWNYETATAHLFPSLSRSLRETSYGFSTDERGRQDFREKLPYGKEHFGVAAADGQMGQIMKLYLDWKLSGDTGWLKRLWPAAKRALEFAWIPGGWDADQDGVMEGVQHNTYDVEFLGPNPLCGVWYLGALRAGAEMARALGDPAGAKYQQLFESGSRWIDANLFNGEYYIQQVRGLKKDQIAPGLMAGMGTADTEHPDFQLGDGCLVDQLAGQYFAEVAGLGPLLDGAHIRAALESIYRYNYKRRLFEHESVQRVYALNDEAALVICDYGKGKRPRIPFPYYAEVMTGFEYSAASLMLYRGMLEQGLELVGNIRRRYDGERRNPWNEAECGHHYARAMASWSAFLALSGFEYHGGEKSVTAKPRVDVRPFRCFWSSGTAWGEFAFPSEVKFTLAVTRGRLALKTLRLPFPPGEARLGRKPLARSVEGGKLVLKQELVLEAGQELTVTD